MKRKLLRVTIGASNRVENSDRMHDSEDAQLATHIPIQPKPPPGAEASPDGTLTPREVAMILNYRAADEVTQARVRMLLISTYTP